MVKICNNTFRNLLSAFAITCFLLIQGCGPRVTVSVKPGFKPPIDLDTVYIVPFTGTLVPGAFKDAVFNEFVDLLNENRQKASVNQFEIIKDSLDELDKDWLSKHVFLSGELWSYIENSGCCRTELRVSAKISMTEPGKQTPSVEILLPADSFFDHDMSTLEKEKSALAKRLARELAERIITPLSVRK